MWPVAQQDRKSLSRLVASAFFALKCTVNAGRTDRKREGEEDREAVGAEGLYKHDKQIRDLSIHQAVTTSCLAN